VRTYPRLVCKPCSPAHELCLIDTWLSEAYRKDLPGYLQEALRWAEHHAGQLPEGNRLLHGDLGRHNMMINANETLYAIDPKGVKGSVEFEVGLAAVWTPSARSNSVDYAHEGARLLGLDLHEVLSWTKIRAAISATSGYNRRELQQHNDCMALYRRIQL
jgi:streptomycin 6-kinase